eukprot:COSAG04_NODE_6753_length_1263_cov_0.889175_1_plen_23_part_10
MLPQTTMLECARLLVRARADVAK